MKQKVAISILLGSMLFVLCGIFLSSCSSDKEEYFGPYKGYIQTEDPTDNTLIIKVTEQPENVDANKMPIKEDVIYVEEKDLPSRKYQEGEKLSFDVISAKSAFMPANIYYRGWYCHIKNIHFE